MTSKHKKGCSASFCCCCSVAKSCPIFEAHGLQHTRLSSSEPALCFRWPKYWSFSISPSNEYSGLIFFRIDWFGLLEAQGTFKSLLQHHNSKESILQPSAFFMIQLSQLYMTIFLTLSVSHSHSHWEVWSYICFVMAGSYILSFNFSRSLSFGPCSLLAVFLTSLFIPFHSLVVAVAPLSTYKCWSFPLV